MIIFGKNDQLVMNIFFVVVLPFLHKVKMSLMDKFDATLCSMFEYHSFN